MLILLTIALSVACVVFAGYTVHTLVQMLRERSTRKDD